jgi:4-hydroxyproline epimerase
MTKDQLPRRIEVIDSHTAGEPTRCVISGGPDLGTGSLAERLDRFRNNHDIYRRALLCEPRGSDVLVGALLLQAADPTAAGGVIFFNNAGYLGMCGHGIIGVATTLAYLGRIGLGEHRFETPVGEVKATLAANGEVTVSNVDSYRHLARVPLQVPGYGIVHGDIAWGGNWFFLIEEHPFTLQADQVEELVDFTWKVRQALIANEVTGAEGAEVDHIELCTAAHDSAHHGRNFVLCPGKAYDRSPCGTGTSAKMACLAADGQLLPGQLWHQEGILGTVFTGSFTGNDTRITPYISGSAYVTAEASLIYLPDDPFQSGIETFQGTSEWV